MSDGYVDKIQVVEGEGGWYYREVSSNGEILNTSEAYSDKSEAIDEASKALDQIEGADLEILDAPQADD